MSKTPKSERQYHKAEQAEERWGGRSHGNLDSDNHPAHKQHADSFDRMEEKRERFDRDYSRHAQNELRANGWNTSGWSSDQVTQGHALASLDHRWNQQDREQER